MRAYWGGMGHRSGNRGTSPSPGAHCCGSTALPCLGVSLQFEGKLSRDIVSLSWPCLSTLRKILPFPRPLVSSLQSLYMPWFNMHACFFGYL